MDTRVLDCPYSGVCGGCAWAGRPLVEQNQEKLNDVQTLFPGADFVYAPLNRVRDKADLIWEDGRLGLYKSSERSILDIESCAMMSPALEDFFKTYRSRKPPIGKGSVRLRVSPKGEWGVWLDFANQDVKTLFEEKDYLRWLSSIAFVEIGQRRKHLIWKDDLPKLVDPELRAWFETYSGNGSAIPLYGPVGGFSQSGFEANRALVGAVLELVKESGVRTWVELFCGNGNFTLALASAGMSIEAVEMDPLAIEGLQKNLPANVKLSRADVYLKSKTLPSLEGRGLLVDPPRAGLREVLSVLEDGNKPSVIVYVSCFTESFVADLARLESLGYRRDRLRAINQFPHSPHSEWAALLTRG
jgi:23S rRNA (uracil1939-C5)-methyltransferase